MLSRSRLLICHPHEESCAGSDWAIFTRHLLFANRSTPQVRRPALLLLNDLHHRIHLIIPRRLVPDLLLTPAAAMNNDKSTGLLIDRDGIHQFPAFRQTITRTITIDVQRS
jgi:hypothetical protein